MQNRKQGHAVRWWVFGGLLVAAGAAGAGYYQARGRAPARSGSGQGESPPARAEIPRVEVCRPQRGGLARTTTQPGSVEAFEWAQLFAGVSGYLKSQTVDIGDRVKKGQILATVDVPDLEKQVQHDQAALRQARAKVDQMRARVVSARAEVEATHAAVTRAVTDRNSKHAYQVFRRKQYDRMKSLYSGQRAVDERLVDEHQDQWEAAREAEGAAEAAIAAAKAAVSAADAKVKQAEADVAEAEAEVHVAQAEMEKAEVLVRFATVAAPFDGVITRRTMFPGDYVRAPREGGTGVPLLTVARTDKLRVVVQVPDRDVPYTAVGQEAAVEVDALRGRAFQGKVARLAGSEDPQTRLMHLEVDLVNPTDKEHPTGRINPGMYGRATIILQKDADLLSVPSSCLAGKSDDGKATLCVIRDGHVASVQVRVGVDNGIRVAVLGGLRPDDQVATSPGGLADGAPATAVDAGGPAGH